MKLLTGTQKTGPVDSFPLLRCVWHFRSTSGMNSPDVTLKSQLLLAIRQYGVGTRTAKELPFRAPQPAPPGTGQSRERKLKTDCCRPVAGLPTSEEAGARPASRQLSLIYLVKEQSGSFKTRSKGRPMANP